MGRLKTQENLFYRFRIDDHVPQDHLLRRIDWLLNFDAIRAELAAFYSHKGIFEFNAKVAYSTIDLRVT